METRCGVENTLKKEKGEAGQWERRPCDNPGRRQWTLGPGWSSGERLGLTVPEFTDVACEGKTAARMTPRSLT